jgi:hypothetical protein
MTKDGNTLFTPLPVFDEAIVNKESASQRTRPHSAQDIFNRLYEYVDMSDDEFNRLIDRHTTKENLRETMDFVLPFLKSYKC